MISDLATDRLQRAAVVSWQAAVVAVTGWNIPISVSEGYWYFYSLRFLQETTGSGRLQISRSDLEEYLADMRGQPAPQPYSDIRVLRSHQINPEEIRWPLMTLDYLSISTTLTHMAGAKGCFENRGELVQHWHLAYKCNNYLLVRHLDDGDNEVMLLGSSRDKQLLHELIALLQGLPQ